MKSSLLNEKVKKIKSNLKKNNINIILILVTIISLIGLVEYKKYEISTRGVRIVFANEDIGVVRSKEEVIHIVDEIESKLSKEYNNDIKINEEIVFLSTHAKDEELTSKDKIEKNIKNNLTFSAVCYAIKVDGEYVAYVNSEELAKEVIAKFKEPFIQTIEDENIKVEDIKVLEDIQIVKENAPVSDIKDIDTALEVLKTGSIEEKTHIVKQDENYWTMAIDYGIDMNIIEEANPDRDPLMIKPGEEVIIPVSKPFITVATYEEHKYIEEVAFETEYEVDNSLYKNQEKVKVEGVLGKTEVVAKIEKHNGIQVAKKVLNEAILSQPIAQVVVKGTKQIPIRAATGTFMTPTRGNITSGFGPRWGRMHQGIDYGARLGTPIKAADGGTVTQAGYNGAYGYLVEINHGNGYTTLYAHCSKIYVKVGQKVAKGDVIAAVGSTGRSTGPHLHFEVRENGVPKNPQDFLK